MGFREAASAGKGSRVRGTAGSSGEHPAAEARKYGGFLCSPKEGKHAQRHSERNGLSDVQYLISRFNY